jgi:mono/diheme cytochrome c family protein
MIGSFGLASSIAAGVVGAVLLTGFGHSMAQAPETQPGMADADAARGRALFARNGCVACHAVNEIGGTSAPPLDIASAPGEVDPIDFVARMWRGAEPMLMMQQSLFGEQLEFTGQELEDIIAFAHDPEEQRKFSEADVPRALRRVIREQ